MDLVKLEAEILQLRLDTAHMWDRAAVAETDAGTAAWNQCGRLLDHAASLLYALRRGEICRNRERMGEVTPL